MIRKKILAVSALVSLIPLASVSIVSCKKKKKTETNKDEQQKPSTPDMPGSPSAPSTPEIENPSVDQNNPSETPKPEQKPEGDNSGSGGSGGGDSSESTPPGDSDSSGGSGSDNNQGSSDSERGIMVVRGSRLTYTQDSSNKWWFNVWIWGSNLSNNINHYNIQVKNKEGNLIDLKSYFRVQEVDTYGGHGYFVQSKRNDGLDNELFEWLKEQYNIGNYGVIIVSPISDNIRPSNVVTPPANDQNQTSSISSYRLQRTYYSSNEPERGIVVSGTNLSRYWKDYVLTWEEVSGTEKITIPSEYFGNSVYSKGNYQVFVLKSTTPTKFLEEFDRLFFEKQSNKDGKWTFKVELSKTQ